MRRLWRDRDDQGTTAILVAISLIALMSVTGLVVDGGNAYSQRRQMQNAADASALAGANALERYRTTAPKPAVSTVWTAAKTNAVDNGAEDTTFTCDLVRLSPSGTELGSVTCPTSGAGSIPADASMVRVGVSKFHKTMFMQAVGGSGFTAVGHAAASLQKASILSAPFMVCANASGHPAPLLIVNSTNIDLSTINPAAVGMEYEIWGNPIKSAGRDCGNPSSSFRGLIDNDQGPFGMPGWWAADQGNKGGQVGPSLATGCSVDGSNVKNLPVGCELALPLCLVGNGQPGNAFEMYCVSAGRFKVTAAGNNSLEAIFLGGGVALGGGGRGVATDQDVVVIKLTE
jgi:hypothetical protein